MAILNFSDVLKKVGLDPQKVKLIRHALSDERFRECYKAGMAHEYTRHQKKEFSKGYDYWVTFISDGGTYARLHSCYCVNGSVPDTPDVCPAGLPDCESKEYRGENAFFDLQYVDILKEYEGKLLPFISEQKYNDAIKKIFKLAGVDRIVTILDPLTHNEIKRPIYEVASSHLARRTFIGNIYKKVKDPNLVSALSGHKEGSKAFRRYRDIDEEMKKDLVKLLD